jgi:hypothetical protein
MPRSSRLRSAPSAPMPVTRVGAILNAVGSAARDAVLDGLDSRDADFAIRVRRAIFTFQHIPKPRERGRRALASPRPWMATFSTALAAGLVKAARSRSSSCSRTCPSAWPSSSATRPRAREPPRGCGRGRHGLGRGRDPRAGRKRRYPHPPRGRGLIAPILGPYRRRHGCLYVTHGPRVYRGRHLLPGRRYSYRSVAPRAARADHARPFRPRASGTWRIPVHIRRRTRDPPQAGRYPSPDHRIRRERQIGGARISFHPAGHVPGSAQIRVEVGGEVWVVSGDYKTVDDGLSTPFEPVRCHTFISESPSACRSTAGPRRMCWRASSTPGGPRPRPPAGMPSSGSTPSARRSASCGCSTRRTGRS